VNSQPPGPTVLSDTAIVKQERQDARRDVAVSGQDRHSVAIDLTVPRPRHPRA